MNRFGHFKIFDNFSYHSLKITEGEYLFLLLLWRSLCNMCETIMQDEYWKHKKSSSTKFSMMLCRYVADDENFLQLAHGKCNLEDTIYVSKH